MREVELLWNRELYCDAVIVRYLLCDLGISKLGYLCYNRQLIWKFRCVHTSPLAQLGVALSIIISREKTTIWSGSQAASRTERGARQSHEGAYIKKWRVAAQIPRRWLARDVLWTADRAWGDARLVPKYIVLNITNYRYRWRYMLSRGESLINGPLTTYLFINTNRNIR